MLHADLTASGHAKSEGLEAGVDCRVRHGRAAAGVGCLSRTCQRLSAFVISGSWSVGRVWAGNCAQRAGSGEPVVTAAEALQTAPTESFPGRVFLECVEGPAQGGPAERPQRQYLQVDWRSRRHRSLTLRRMDILYGCCGTQWGVRDLST